VRAKGRLLALILLLTTVGCDRATKHFAKLELENSPPRVFLGGLFRLEYAENTGAFLSLGASLPAPLRTGLLTFGVAAGLTAIAVLAWKRRWSGSFLAAAALIWAGGASNLADRAIRGSVVDFMVLEAGPLRTGVFNVADVAIMLGAFLLVVSPVKNSSSVP
jgi:signal peptidase II